MYKTKATINFIFSILLLFYSVVINADKKVSEIEATQTSETIKDALNKTQNNYTPSDKSIKSDEDNDKTLNSKDSNDKTLKVDIPKDDKTLKNKMSPDAIARDITEKLILQFYKYSAEFRNNETLMFEQVEQILRESVAFEEVTKSVMGKYVARASKKQINKFTTILKTSLIRFYSKIFLEFNAEKFVIQRIEEVSQATIDEYLAGNIRLISVELVVTRGSEKYPIKYSMVKSDNAWKLKNIIFNGINIGRQLRNQFSDFYNKSRDIDSAIELWAKVMSGSKNK